MAYCPALPPELWTHIWSFACTDDGATGRVLSQVSRHVYATSAPVRLQSITLTGLRDLLAFAYMIRSSPKTDMLAHQVRYLTVMADTMPMSSQELVEEFGLRERLIMLNRNSTGSLISSPSTPTTPEQRRVAEKKRERFFLHTLFNMLRLLSPTLLELELSLQAIQSPSFFSHIGCSSSVWPHQNHPVGPLEFPKLVYFFYACPPSGVLPWLPVTCQPILPPQQPHIEGGVSTPDTSPDVLANDEQTPHVPFFCPRLRELMVVCDDSQAGDPDESVVIEEEEQEEPAYESERRPDDERTDYLNPDFDNENVVVETRCSPLTSLAPSLQTLTVLASSPAKTITAMYSASSVSDPISSSVSSMSLESALVAELELAAAAAEWESLFVPYAYEENIVSSMASQSRYSALESAVDGPALERMSKAVPQTVEKVICTPRARWDESWDAFKAGVQKGLKEAEKMEEESDSTKTNPIRRIEFCVVPRCEVS